MRGASIRPAQRCRTRWHQTGPRDRLRAVRDQYMSPAMSFTSVTPGLVPDVGVVASIVLDDFGKAGGVYREAAATFEAGGAVDSCLPAYMRGS
jgi:hypothetical protein